jgi:hypothetical protein
LEVTKVDFSLVYIFVVRFFWRISLLEFVGSKLTKIISNILNMIYRIKVLFIKINPDLYPRHRITRVNLDKTEKTKTTTA